LPVGREQRYVRGRLAEGLVVERGQLHLLDTDAEDPRGELN
jgi:hypothetical protein